MNRYGFPVYGFPETKTIAVLAKHKHMKECN